MGMRLMGAAMGLGFIAGPGIGGIIGSHNLPFFRRCSVIGFYRWIGIFGIAAVLFIVYNI